MAYQRTGSEILVNTTVTGNQLQPIITRLTTGGFVIFWLEEGGVARGQIFDADGGKAGGEFAATAEAAAPLLGGGFVLTWSDGASIRAQLYDGGGGAASGILTVNSSVGSPQGGSSVALLDSGGFVVTWDDARGIGSGDVDIRGQRYDAFGNKLGGEFVVNSVTAGIQQDSEVTALAGGGFVVAWSSGGAVKAQIHDSAGVKVGGEILVSNDSLPIEQQIVALSSGGFAVAWTRNTSQGNVAAVDGIYVQMFSAAGVKVGTATRISDTGPAQLLSLDAAALATGGFVVTWAANDGDDQDSTGTAIRAQVLDDLGNELGAEIVVNATAAGDQLQPVVTGLASGGFAISWADASQSGGDTSGYAIRSQIFQSVPAVTGTIGADDLDGTALNDDIYGLGGNDTLEGGAAGDLIDGGEGDDVVRGEGGSDILIVSGPGFDQAEGGADEDMLVVDYSDSFTGIATTTTTANAALGGFDGVYDDGAGRQIIYSSIETFRVTGGTAADSITTGGGDDVIIGGGGNDVIDAGEGEDIVKIAGAGHATVTGGPAGATDGTDLLSIDWSNSLAAVTLTAPAYSGVDGFSGTFGNGGDRSVTYARLERLHLATGSGNDSVTVTLGEHMFDLGAGNDVLDTGGAVSNAEGGSGTDRVSADLSQAGAVLWNLQTNAYSGPGSYSGFEYFGLLTLGAGNDTITTGTAALGDDIVAGAGFDTVRVFNGLDSVDGGANVDLLIIDYSAATAPVNTVGFYNGIIAGTSGTGAKGAIGDGIGREIVFDNIERLDIRTGSNSDVIYTGRGNVVTHDIVSLGAGTDGADLGRGIDRADGGAGVDQLNVDMSGLAGAVSYNLLTNSYSGPAGTFFTNFEYLGENEFLGSGFRTGSGNDSIVTHTLALTDILTTNGGDDSATFYNGHDSFLAGAGIDTLIVDYSAATSNVFGDSSPSDTDNDGDHAGKFTDLDGRSAYFLDVEKFVVTTGSGNDTIMGGGSDDIITTGAGADTLDGRGGADVMTGGIGNDLYFVDDIGDQTVEEAGAGIADEVRTGLASYTLAANVELLTGTSGAGQALTGNIGANLIVGGAGADVINGGAGGDVMVGGLGNDVYYVDSDGDFVAEEDGGGIDEVRTGMGSKAPPDRLVFILPHFVENLTGTAVGAQGVRDNVLDNVINMGAGHDLVVADAGGVDTINGGGGNDFIYHGDELTGADVTNGGSGIDTIGLLGDYGAGIVFTAANLVGVERMALYTSLYLPGTGPNDYAVTMDDANVAAGTEFFVTAASLQSNESLTFNGAAETNGRFTVHGGGGADTISGGAGNDFLIGNAGADQLFGLGGIDTLVGGLGADQLRGGAGGDFFRYLSTAQSTAGSVDQILDFRHADRIDLSAIDADGNAGNGDQAFAFIGSGAFTNAAGQLRAWQSGGSWFVEGDVNGDGAADLIIEVTLADPAPMAAADFIL